MCLREKFCGAYSYRLGAISAVVVHAVWTASQIVLAADFVSLALAEILQPKVNDNLLVYSVIGGLYIVTCILSCVSLILFVVGASKNSHALVLSFLVCDVLQITVSLLGCIWGLIVQIYICSALLCGTFLKIYMWIVVLQFYRELYHLFPGGSEGTVLI